MAIFLFILCVAMPFMGGLWLLVNRFEVMNLLAISFGIFYFAAGTAEDVAFQGKLLLDFEKFGSPVKPYFLSASLQRTIPIDGFS